MTTKPEKADDDIDALEALESEEKEFNKVHPLHPPRRIATNTFVPLAGC
jgi:hypothetical protein